MITLWRALRDGYGSRLAFADEHRWAAASHRTAHLRCDERLEARVVAPEPIQDVRFSADGGRLLLAPLVYDLGSGRFLAQHPLDAALDQPRSFDFTESVWSADGELLLQRARHAPPPDADDDQVPPAESERLLLFHGAARERPETLYAGQDDVRGLAIDERRIAAGGDRIRLWERAAPRHAEVLRGLVAVCAVALVPDGQVVAASAAGQLGLWIPGEASCAARWTAHTGFIQALALHPRRPLVATGATDGSLKLWSLDSPGQLLHEERLGDPVDGVAFSPSGERLAIAVRSEPARLALYSLRR